ncbi:MAG: GAF domain-containing SpoIIE family protein phosphatase [bacterium]
MVEHKDDSLQVHTLEEENHRLKRAIEELTVLNDLARSIGALSSTEEIIHTIIKRSLRAVHAEQGVITLVEKEPNAEGKTLIRTQVGSNELPAFHLCQAMLGWMHLNKKPLVLNDPHHDARFEGIHIEPTIRSLLCVPMMIKSELIGVLTVYNKKEPNGFTEDDQRLLAIITGQSAQVVENARLYEEEKTLAKMMKEVQLAVKIQTDLLPKTLPQIEGYDIAALTIPAKQVGGDYYDFIEFEDQRLGICLGDVSGKGLPAALLMANLQATLRGQSMLTDAPKECMIKSNKLLFHSTGSDKFATIVYAILDTQNHTLIYTNAGHERPVLLTTNLDPYSLEVGGIPLGLLVDFPFEEESITFPPGGTLVIVSDGITEAANVDEDQFGAERAVQIVKENLHLSASMIIDRVVSDVKQFAEKNFQLDDITMIVIKRIS